MTYQLILILVSQVCATMEVLHVDSFHLAIEI